MKKIRLDFNPIVKGSIVNTLYQDVSLITVNGGGGMGGTYEEIRCKILNHKTVDLGFLLVKDVISNEMIEINPRYIGTIKEINLTEVYFKHNNSNFPSGKRTYWFSHKIGTRLELCDEDDRQYPSITESMKDSNYKLKTVCTFDN